MKKFIKNTVLTFVILFTVLNILLYATNIILKNSMLKEIVTIYLAENRDMEASIQLEESANRQINEMKDIYGQEVPATALLGARAFINGMDEIIYGQTAILIITLILSIIMGIVLSLTEKSKAKEVLYFISGGILFILLCTVYMWATRQYINMHFIEAIVETINPYGIYYIIGYLLVFIYRYCKNKKDVVELNKEIKTKNK